MRKRSAFRFLTLLGLCGFGFANGFEIPFKPSVELQTSYQDATDNSMRTQDLKNGRIVVGLESGNIFIKAGIRNESGKINIGSLGSTHFWSNQYSILLGYKLPQLKLTVYGLFGRSYSNRRGIDKGYLGGIGIQKEFLGWKGDAFLSYYKPADNYSFYRWELDLKATHEFGNGFEITPELIAEYQGEDIYVSDKGIKGYAKLKLAREFQTQYGKFKPYIFGGVGKITAWQEGLFSEDTKRAKEGEIGAGLNCEFGRVKLSLSGAYEWWKDLNSDETVSQSLKQGKLVVITDTTGGYAVNLSLSVGF